MYTLYACVLDDGAQNLVYTDVLSESFVGYIHLDLSDVATKVIIINLCSS